MRVFITGLGGVLGTRVARRLEQRSEVTALAGSDIEPPRRRLRRTEFHYVRPTEPEPLVETIAAFEPTAIAHIGVYEPFSRTVPRVAELFTEVTATAVARSGVRRVVMRSGIEVYGRGRDSPDVPDEGAPLRPTAGFGRMMALAESKLPYATRLRFAPLSGARMPSPLVRYLRMPVVPVGMWPGKPFSLLHVDDAARAVEVALLGDATGALNVVGEGSITPVRAVRAGGRVPVPLLGSVLRASKSVTEVAGSPLPDHTRELLTKGLLAEGFLGAAVLGKPERTTEEVLDDLYDWPAADYQEQSSA